MIIYLIGIIVAAILIGRNIVKRNHGEEYSGDILCYVFALLSWGIVFLLLIAKLYEYISNKISNDKATITYGGK
jgi:hypothetical protein